MTSMDYNSAQSDSGNKFHWLFLPGARTRASAYDTVIKETQHFVALPTKGSIVAGWLLIVPKFPITRMADVPLELHDELHDFVSQISSKLKLDFGKPYVFEHGGFKGSPVSCGVDQAHLHIAALNFDLIKAAATESRNGWNSVHSGIPRDDKIGSGEYWFVSDGSTSKYKIIDKAHSQFFRKIIAQEMGVPDLWDYRSEDFVDNIKATLAAMGGNG